MRRVIEKGAAALCLLLLAGIAGCGSGRWGYARTYEAWGDENAYLEREVELSYEDVRRFPDRYADDLIGWFGTVTEIEQLDRSTGQARISLQLRAHQDRHLCSDETSGSCRVTVSDRPVGPFTALVTLRAEDLTDGRERLWTGSLMKVYGHVQDGGTEESGPVLQVEWYRHWPHGYFVTTGAAGSMRR
ncbi:MAG: hypothetical protein AB7S26_25835 [Sandaracinaceae bacterium]